jgi:hypothetical protein
MKKKKVDVEFLDWLSDVAAVYEQYRCDKKKWFNVIKKE